MSEPVSPADQSVDQRALELSAWVAAINRIQGVIEFNLDGTVITANDNFLTLVGYTLREVRGQHHRMFCEPGYAATPEYQMFWAKLNRGEADVAEYRRIGKGGKEVWIQASYNPIMDPTGRPCKVVKFATDITEAKRGQLALAHLTEECEVALGALARGDLTRRIEGNYSDALARVQTSFNEAVTNLGETMRQLAGTASSLAATATQISGLGQQLGASATETTAQAETVSTSSDQIASNVATVAAGTEEMNSSIREIARNSSDAAKVAQEAVTLAEGTNSTVRKLGTSSAAIGQVIKVITSIAQQTNLLALNATIEAARAGDAGKGFAVVATEVKELAKKTAAATDDIARRIEAIQEDTKVSVDAIQRIGEVIHRVNDLQIAIAGAVEEQTATTSEMARNINAAAHGAREITRNVAGVATAARETSAAAEQSSLAANQLGSMSIELQELVHRFRVESGAAARVVPENRRALARA